MNPSIGLVVRGRHARAIVQVGGLNAGEVAEPLLCGNGPCHAHGRAGYSSPPER